MKILQMMEVEEIFVDRVVHEEGMFVVEAMEN